MPLDGKSNLLLRYRGKKRTFPYLSAADVLSGQVPAGALRGKIVFVGTTALGTREVVATPLDTLFAGVEVQATVADNLLEQDFIRRSALGATLESLIVLVLGIAIGGAGRGSRYRRGWSARPPSVAALWWGAVWLLSTQRPVHIAAVPDDRRSGRARDHDAREVHGRARARRQRRPRKDRRPAADGAGAPVADRSQGRRDGPSFAPDPAVRPAAGGAARHAARLPRLSHAANGSTCSRAWRRCTTSARWGFPITSSTSPGALTPEELVEMRKHPVSAGTSSSRPRREWACATMRRSRWRRTSSTRITSVGTGPDIRRACAARRFRSRAG